MRATVAQLDGAYSLVVCSADEPGTLVGVKVSSPLVVGLGDGETVAASDIPADSGSTPPCSRSRRSASVTHVRAPVFNLDGDEVAEPITVDLASRRRRRRLRLVHAQEIDEQPAAIRDTLAGPVMAALAAGRAPRERRRSARGLEGVRGGVRDRVPLGARREVRDRALDGPPVEIESPASSVPRPGAGPRTGSRSRYRSPARRSTRSRRPARERQGSLDGGDESVGSSMAREADAVLYMHAGPEIGVAATKTFTTQMVSLHLVALYLAQVRGTMFPRGGGVVLRERIELPGKVGGAIRLDAPGHSRIAERFRDARDALFIGRHTGYPAALEGALKLKELSTIHA